MGFDGDVVVSSVGCGPRGPGFNTCPLQTIIQENLQFSNLNGDSGSVHKKIIEGRKLSLSKKSVQMLSYKIVFAEFNLVKLLFVAWQPKKCSTGKFAQILYVVNRLGSIRVY